MEHRDEGGAGAGPSRGSAPAVPSGHAAGNGRARPAVGTVPAGQPAWHEARAVGSITWQVMTRGYYWAGRDGAAKYTVTWNNPIRDGYHVLRSTADSAFLVVQPEEARDVVASLEAYLRGRKEYVPGTREVFGLGAKP